MSLFPISRWCDYFSRSGKTRDDPAELARPEKHDITQPSRLGARENHDMAQLNQAGEMGKQDMTQLGRPGEIWAALLSQ